MEVNKIRDPLAPSLDVPRLYTIKCGTRFLKETSNLQVPK